MLEIAGSADATLENFLDARVATLSDDLCRKINLVMRSPDSIPKACRIDSIALLTTPKAVPFLPE